MMHLPKRERVLQIGYSGLKKASVFWRKFHSSRGFITLFVLGIALGFFIKSVAHDRLTIGHDDYLLPKSQTLIDINQIQKEFIRQGGSLATNKPAIRSGQACRETSKE